MVAWATSSTSSATTVSTWYTNSTSASTSASTTAGTAWYSDGTNTALPTRIIHVEKELKGKLSAVLGNELTLKLPDGASLEIAKDGSYALADKDAKVVYKASRIREFNPFINASDKLEDFIRFWGEHGVKQDEMMNLPIKHFIAWLIVEAAKVDNVTPDTDLPLLPAPQPKEVCRCGSCGRFLAYKKKAAKFCAVECYQKALAA